MNGKRGFRESRFGAAIIGGLIGGQTGFWLALGWFFWQFHADDVNSWEIWRLGFLAFLFLAFAFAQLAAASAGVGAAVGAGAALLLRPFFPPGPSNRITPAQAFLAGYAPPTPAPPTTGNKIAPAAPFLPPSELQPAKPRGRVRAMAVGFFFGAAAVPFLFGLAGGSTRKPGAGTGAGTLQWLEPYLGTAALAGGIAGALIAGRRRA